MWKIIDFTAELVQEGITLIFTFTLLYIVTYISLGNNLPTQAGINYDTHHIDEETHVQES